MNTRRRSLPALAAWLAVAAGTAFCQDRPAPAAKGRTGLSGEALPAANRPAPSLEVTVDTSAAPEMAAWAARAKSLCQQNYPLLLTILGGPEFQPPRKVKLLFKNIKGAAHTAGDTITCAVPYFKGHPGDYGAVIHELCHVVQAYGPQKVPGWVTEGIADYVRWFRYEPPNRRPRVNPKRAKYTDGYQTTAAFFDWICRTKDPGFVNRLNAAARGGQYRPELFQERAGKPLDELWAQFVASLPKEPPRKK
jgi:hypothetical protein